MLEEVVSFDTAVRLLPKEWRTYIKFPFLLKRSASTAPTFQVSHSPVDSLTLTIKY